MSFCSVVMSQDTFRSIFDQAPVGMAHVSREGKWLEVNRRLCEMTGYSREELLASNFQQITHPDDLPANLDGLTKLASGALGSYSVEKRYVCKDGRTIWVKVAVSGMREPEHREPLFFITVVDEITEYKRAQELRFKAEEKCSKAFRQTPVVLTLVSLVNDRYIEINEAFEHVTGYSREEAIGRTPYDLGLWVDPDRRRAMMEAVLAGDPIQGWESRFRTKDGRIRTGLVFAERIEIEGEDCLLMSGLDITDRKRLEMELQELSGRLIEAQDEERRRIAAELTDSLGQSVTVISFEAGQLARSTPNGLGRDLHALCAKIQDVATGIGILSQSLHPSGLDYTGLPWAIECLCRQFTHLYGLQVAFKHEGIPSAVSPEIAVGLYRIVQEGLRNIVQHSGTRQAWIELGCDGRSIRLDLWDEGVGFNEDSAKAGLGLPMMRERCRRLNGSLEIRNKKGTRLEIEIPLANAEPKLFSASLDVAVD